MKISVMNGPLSNTLTRIVTAKTFYEGWEPLNIMTKGNIQERD
jgi:hypothetical protein